MMMPITQEENEQKNSQLINKNNKKLSPKPAARRQARYFIVQALYQWQLAETPLTELIAQFRFEHQAEKVDWPFFEDVLNYVLVKSSAIDKTFEHHIDRPLAHLDPIEKAILRLGAYELTKRSDIPYRVSINESIEMAKIFGADESHKYVNGILDKLAERARVAERV